MVQMVPAQIAERLRSLIKGDVLVSEPMRNHTSFRIGGPADVLVVPADVDDLKKLLAFASENEIPVTVIGNGTNLLVADAGIRGIVVKMSGCLDYVRISGTRVTAGAGTNVPALVRMAARRGLAGLEFAAGIPGSVGGCIAMNAGAYGKTMADVVEEVTALDFSGNLRTFSNAEMVFGPRTSRLQDGDLIAIEATFRLEEGDVEAIEKKIATYMHERRIKQPLAYPSAGCIFRNPAGTGAGRFIDAAGLKGFRVGDAQVSEVHANFIINLGNATASDVLALMRKVQIEVKDKFGVELEPEVKVVGG